jgi:Peptidase family C25
MKRVVRRTISTGCLVAIVVSLLASNWLCLGVNATGSNTKLVVQSATVQQPINIYSALAVITDQGVLLQWSSDTSKEILGFNIYRLADGERTKINREVVPGSVFLPEQQSQLQSRTPYAFLDRAGNRDSVYLIEAVSVSGTSVATSVTAVAGQGLDRMMSMASSTPNTGPDSERAQDSSATELPESAGALDDQWTIAAQSALKIGIKRDGWYKVTHQQASAAGFNPVVDIKNLRLFVNGREVQILTNKPSGTFSSGDSFEFYGLGLDTATTDTRTYYLIAGTQAGRRLTGELRRTALPSPATRPDLPDFSTPVPKLWYSFILRFITGVGDAGNEGPAEPRKDTKTSETTRTPDAQLDEKRLKLKTTGVKKRKSASKTRAKVERSHAVATPARTFTYSVQRKDRLVYFISLLNGDTENYFGQVISSSPITQTISTPNPDLTAAGPARLEVSLQGVGLVDHAVDVTLNNVLLGSLSYFGLGQGSQTFDVPLSLLNNGDNALKFTSTTVPSNVSLIDFTRLTYPRILRAENNSLRFSSRPTQTITVDGFTTAELRLLDCTDPFALTLSRPISEPSAGGYAIKIEPSAVRTKGRLLYAFPDTQNDTPASFSLNQPSTLNLSSNGADLVIIAHKDLIPSTAPLVTLRQSQGMQVLVVDVEDVYDEFSFGVHGPQAIKSFLTRANSTWTRAPRYAILLGDASIDPRNYEGAGNFDLVPTKLVDTVLNETADDDWLSDFNNDGIADIPLGRLPARTLAEANNYVSKIVNFSPANVPQSALLIADDPSSFYFDFELASDQLQSLLPTSFTVHRVNRRTDPNARNNVIAYLNAGESLVNYTGHGNVDVWTGANFTSPDATALTNGNKLPFVVVMNCLNGYYVDVRLLGLAEAFMKTPNGGAIAVFASSGLTGPDGQQDMARELYRVLYGTQPITIGDACKMAKAATSDLDIRRTWILFGDPSMRIR